MSETCANCGHDYDYHYESAEEPVRKGCIKCSCEKFQPQNQSPQSNVQNRMSEKVVPSKDKTADKASEVSLVSHSSGADNPSLSDKIVLETAIKTFIDSNDEEWIKVKDVKEFVRRLKEETLKWIPETHAVWWETEILDKLAGKELSKFDKADGGKKK